MQEIDLASAIESNWLKLGTLEMQAHADRIIVVQDEFRSGYECGVCEGKMLFGELTHVVCPDCKGSGRRGEKKCSGCSGEGLIVCPECNGKGGVLTVPEQSERRPTTGVVVSTGPDVTKVARGESVIYTSYVGHAYDLKAFDIHGNEVSVAFTIMKESEFLAKVKGHLELRRVKRSAAMGTAA